jgi:hypothetical protein
MLCHSVYIGLGILEACADVLLVEECLGSVNSRSVAATSTRWLLLGLAKAKSAQRSHVGRPVNFRGRLMRSAIVSFLRAICSSAGLETWLIRRQQQLIFWESVEDIVVVDILHHLWLLLP